MSNSGSSLIDAVNAAYPAMAQFYASDWYVAEAANEGWYVGQGCAITASGTSGKFDMSAGTILIGTTDLVVTAVTASSTTVTSLADATNPKWVACEVDTSGVLQFNAGTAAANPEKPTPISSRVVVAWVYVPATAATVDALTSSANGKAKIIDARMLRPGPAVTGWSYDQNTWTNPNTTVASGSNGVATSTFASAGTLNVASTTGFPASGILNVTHSGTISQVSYTAIGSGTTFTGCTLVGTTVTMATSDVVRLQGFAISSASDYSATYQKGFPFRWRESATTKWNNVFASSFASSVTYVCLGASGDSTAQVVAAPDVNSVALSASPKPQGFPSYFTWVPNPVGYSAVPTSTYYQWSVVADTCTLHIREGANGTSNATTKSYWLPYFAATVSNANWNGPACVVDNSAVKTGMASLAISSGNISLTASTDASSVGAWTNSGGARIVFGTCAYRF